MGLIKSSETKMTQEEVLLVDDSDTPIGRMEKIRAHEEGQLHRAFSIFIYNDKNEMLLQRRAHSKYHSPGLWTNTCCSHPRPHEDTKDAAHRKLQQEMGFDTKLHEVFSFIYKAPFDNGLTEHEFDHVFMGLYNENPQINPEEASEYKWISIPDLKSDMKQNPQNYTAWFKIAIESHPETLLGKNHAESDFQASSESGNKEIIEL